MVSTSSSVVKVTEQDYADQDVVSILKGMGFPIFYQDRESVRDSLVRDLTGADAAKRADLREGLYAVESGLIETATGPQIESARVKNAIWSSAVLIAVQHQKLVQRPGVVRGG